MGRVGARRLAALERRAEEAAWRVATMRLPDDDLAALVPWYERALQADDAGVSRPRPTPEEQQALNRWVGLYERARLEGWGTDPPPGLAPDAFG
jgi:hypothetical protein